EAPWLGDQDNIFFHLLELLLYMPESLDPDQLGQVKTEAIEAKSFYKIFETVHDQPLTHRSVRPKGVTATAPVHQKALLIRLEIIVLIDEQEVIGLTVVII